MKEIIDTIWSASASAVTTGINNFMWQALLGILLMTIIGLLLIGIVTWWIIKTW